MSSRSRARLATLASASALLVLLAPAGGNASDRPSAAQESSVSLASAPVIGAVGDMACDPADSKFNGGLGTSSACAQRRLSDLMLGDASLEAILGLGDYQYDCGDAADYAVSYNPTWGRLDPLIDPVAGNHEYKTGRDLFGGTCPSDNTSAYSYFTHFGAAAHPVTGGHFSFDLGSWHLIALNGNCGKTGVGGCSASSAQTTWLKADLAATTQPCVAAFWHQPLFTAAPFGGKPYRFWWDALYAAHADVAINGHVHNYQRYPALTPTGIRDPVAGLTEYVVGTGGEGFTKFVASASPQPVIHLQSFGYLQMTLADSGWSAEFIGPTGAVLDTSSGSCHPK
jgi:hypothetical protein